MNMIALKEEDYIFVKEKKNFLIDPVGWRVEIFKGVGSGYIKTSSRDYRYCVPFSKFNPEDMIATQAEILYVKNGQLVKRLG